MCSTRGRSRCTRRAVKAWDTSDAVWCGRVVVRGEGRGQRGAQVVRQPRAGQRNPVLPGQIAAEAGVVEHRDDLVVAGDQPDLDIATYLPRVTGVRAASSPYRVSRSAEARISPSRGSASAGDVGMSAFPVMSAVRWARAPRRCARRVQVRVHGGSRVPRRTAPESGPGATAVRRGRPALSRRGSWPGHGGRRRCPPASHRRVPGTSSSPNTLAHQARSRAAKTSASRADTASLCRVRSTRRS